MTSTPEINGYRFDQRLLDHPLAEIWRGRSFTGMEVVALVLSEAGAADPVVRERLDQASRVAALEPGRQQTPLWAANLTAVRPYAITQLVPGESGAERLIDPLDGLIGNDTASVDAVRAQLAQYGAAPIPAEAVQATAQDAQPLADPTQTHAPATGPETDLATGASGGSLGADGADGGDATDEDGERKRPWMYVAAVAAVLVVFSVTFSAGAAIGAAVKDDGQAPQSAPPVAVSPSPLPTPILLPGIPKPSGITYVPPAVGFEGLTGVSYEKGADIQVVDDLGLPFNFGFPAPPIADERIAAESSSIIYRRVTNSDPRNARLDVRIAVHPCRDLAGCLADRAGFDQAWTKEYKAPRPTDAKDGRTWFTRQQGPPYALTMTHAFARNGQWWLVGVAATGLPGEEQAVQRIVNDIWRQTP
ncbi:hypothetical protein FB561_1944 [Kribbella amoyensis]|uniref:Uncharacterized protein n=1 Tax=Kribbella amoyensis TaxID=996641 RepID=A0A561BPQ6_9ACTN|nr:hypothetical protein [Kribbella amoyensis]TWD80848.1 hypothetical protein FB561_1944 [Kribbella amoyensis]